MEIEDLKENIEKTTLADDGVFKVTLGPAVSTASPANTKEQVKLFQPHPRMNCGLAVKHGVLYLYGGMFEDGDKQVTFRDLYSLDLKKLEEWNVIIPDDTSTQEWLESSSDEEASESDSQSDDDEEDSSMDTE